MTTARHTLLMTGRHLRASLRDPGPAYIAPTIIPLALIGIISQVFDATSAIPGFPTDSLVDWMLPGMMVMVGMFGAGVTAIRLVADHRTGYLDRLRLSPVGPTAVLAAAALFDAVRTIPPAIAVLGVGLALGAPLEAGPLGAVALVAVAVIWSLAWNALFLVVGLLTRSEQATQALAPLFLPLWWTSSVLIPEPLMPGWIRTISAVNPISLLVDATRPLAIGGDLDAAAVVAGLTVAGALIVGFQLGATRLYTALVAAD